MRQKLKAVLIVCTVIIAVSLVVYLYPRQKNVLCSEDAIRAVVLLHILEDVRISEVQICCISLALPGKTPIEPSKSLIEYLRGHTSIAIQDASQCNLETGYVVDKKSGKPAAILYIERIRSFAEEAEVTGGIAVGFGGSLHQITMTKVNNEWRIDKDTVAGD